MGEFELLSDDFHDFIIYCSYLNVIMYTMKFFIGLNLWMQFCKNIVLAGVGSLVLNDDNPATGEALAANFLIPFDENMGGGGSLAELCCDSLKDFNPMVHVSVEKGMPF